MIGDAGTLREADGSYHTTHSTTRIFVTKSILKVLIYISLVLEVVRVFPTDENVVEMRMISARYIWTAHALCVILMLGKCLYFHSRKSLYTESYE